MQKTRNQKNRIATGLKIKKNKKEKKKTRI